MQLHIQVTPQLKQTMTTEIIQHLEILQLSNVDLAQEIRDRALENPLLVVDDTNDYVKDLMSVSKFSRSASSGQHDLVLPPRPSHLDFLMEQMPLHKPLSVKEEQVLRYLIYNLDERLFLTVHADEVAKLYKMSSTQVESLILILQSFEPFGVATQNSVDFMLKQTRLDRMAPPNVQPFIQEDLDAVAQLNLKYLATKYKLSKKEVMTVIAYIKSLQPFPVHPILESEVMWMIPDLEVVKVADEWIIELNNQLLPKVSLNESYAQLLKGNQMHRVYYQSRLKDALLLIEGIEERRETVYRLVRWLLDVQHSFFEEGKTGLKPLRLKDAAHYLGLHESTVSRAIREKYVRTPHGVYALKTLFAKGIVYAEEQQLTSDRIKVRIRQLISQEDQNSPLSDQQLMDCLQQEYIQISRRTVTKYRESLQIPNSTKRTYLHAKLSRN